MESSVLSEDFFLLRFYSYVNKIHCSLSRSVTKEQLKLHLNGLSGHLNSNNNNNKIIKALELFFYFRLVITVHLGFQRSIAKVQVVFTLESILTVNRQTVRQPESRAG